MAKEKSNSFKTDLRFDLPIEREVLKNSEIFYRNSKNTFPIKPLIPINKDFGFLLGAILAEGWIGKDCIKIVNTNQDFIREVTLSAEKVFGSLSLKVTSKERGGRRKPLFVLTLPLLPTLFIREILKLKGKSWQKSVPSFAYFSSKDFVAGLLKGFFMGDGSEYIKLEKRDYKIRLYTNSKELKDGLNLLLLKLGILAKIKEDKKDKTHKNWKRNYILEITGLENLQKFYQLVLDKEFKGKVKNSGREKIPQIIQNLKRLIKIAGLKKEELEDLGIWQGTFDRCVRKNSISLDYLREVIEKLDKRIEDPLLENLKILIEGDLYWDPIKSIKRVEVPEYVYDFEVDVEGDLVQNFLGGEGLVCLHNTALDLLK
jgi:intein/homing endonuclease